MTHKQGQRQVLSAILVGPEWKIPGANNPTAIIAIMTIAMNNIRVWLSQSKLNRSATARMPNPTPTIAPIAAMKIAQPSAKSFTVVNVTTVVKP